MPNPQDPAIAPTGHPGLIHFGAVKGPQEAMRNRQTPDSRWSSWIIGRAAVNKTGSGY
jgi:hypothetical protein